MNQPDAEQQRREDLTLAVNLAACVAAPFEIQWHRGFGVRFLPIRVAIGGVFIAIVGMIGSRHAPLWPMSLFAMSTFLMGIAHQLEAWRAEAMGEIRHSGYSGRPWMMEVLPCFSERAIKQWIEPGLTMLFGCVVGIMHGPMGTMTILGGLAMAFTGAFQDYERREHARDLRDVWIEQEIAAEAVPAG